MLISLLAKDLNFGAISWTLLCYGTGEVSLEKAGGLGMFFFINGFDGGENVSSLAMMFPRGYFMPS